jgi:thermitase
LAAVEAPGPSGGAAEPPARRIIVEWAPGADQGDRADARQAAEVSSQGNLGDPQFQLLSADLGQTATEAIDALESDPAVAVAEPDGYVSLTAIPDDPLFGQLWGLQNQGSGVAGFSGAIAGDDIDVLGAWARTVGTPTTVVADIDSGYRFDSPDLGPVAWDNGGEIPSNAIDDDGNGYVDDIHGYDFVGTDVDAPAADGDPTEDNLVSGGHGVHTAGTIGAAGDNGIGITGVAQDARIMPLRVCSNSPSQNDKALCLSSEIIAAINYAGANGARVANLSLGGTTFSAATRDALAGNPETLYVIAAGNDGQNHESAPHYPCDYDPTESGVEGAINNVVCVAATDQADGLAGFSDWSSETVDLGAPGTEILSTYPAIEDLFGESFEEDDFESKWTLTGADGGFARTNEAPLSSFGISDSPGATPVAGSGHSSTLSSPIALPAGYGACRFLGRDFISLGGGTATLIIFKNGLSAYTFQLPSTGGSQMASFTTVPMTGLAGSTVGIRVRYIAGPSPSTSSGVWLDDLKLSCYAPASTAPVYAFLQGTSMAAPHVSGVAALLFSLKPSATVTEVRDALLDNTDPVASLAGKTVSGGRLDADAALDSFVDEAPPVEPSLTSTDPPSPANDNQPKLIGTAEAGSTVDLYRGSECDVPVASATAAKLEAPGIAVSVPISTTYEFTATATDAAQNTSACSDPISYTNNTKVAVVGGGEVITQPLGEPFPIAMPPGASMEPPPTVVCRVPKLAGKTLAQAKSALAAAGCVLGKVTKPKPRHGRRPPPLVVKSSSPAAGSGTGSGVVGLTLGPKPKKRHH